MFGDVCQMYWLVNAYKSSLNIISNSTKKELTGEVEEFKQLSEIPLTGTKFTSVMERINAKFKKAIMDCYENFHSFVEPIVSGESTLQMMEYYKKALPNHYNMMKSMLEFDKKESLTENKHLVEQGYYDKRIFYQFLSLCRTKNCHNCPHWALTSKLADYGRGITDYSHSSNIFFGNSTSYSTFTNGNWRSQLKHNRSQKEEVVKGKDIDSYYGQQPTRISNKISKEGMQQ